MANPDDNGRKTVRPTNPADERLTGLGRRWFADARETSARDEADFAAWNRERQKWSPAGGFGDGGWPESGGSSGGSGD